MNNQYLYLGIIAAIFFIGVIYFMFVLLGKMYKKREETITQNVIKYFESKEKEDKDERA